MSAYRTPAKVEPDEPKVLRSGKCSISGTSGVIQVQWDDGSGHVEVGAWDSRGAPIQFVRMTSSQANTLVDALTIAIRSASSR